MNTNKEVNKDMNAEMQKLIDSGNIDTDPVCETELFRELKFAIAGFQFQHLSMNKAKTAIEANPATHRIAKYVYHKLVAAGQSSIDMWTDIINYFNGTYADLTEREMKDAINFLKTKYRISLIAGAKWASSGEAVEFGNWLKENGWQSINITMHDTKETKTIWSSKWGKGTAQTEQLYQLFKQKP